MPTNNPKKLKIAVVHDHLGWNGGGERTVLLMALDLGADFITAYAHPNTFPDYQKQLGNKLIILSEKVINTRVVRFFWLRTLFWRHKKLFKQYDIIIASAPTATEMVAKFAKRGATKITYTHTTPRRIYDKYEYSKNTYPIILRPLFAVFVRIWRWLYMRAILKYDYNIANSENTKKRVEQHTLTEVNEVIWPPILTQKFIWQEPEDYYLSWARVDELKRVELIIKAFKQMPEKKLIVASGGPRLEMVKKLAEDSPNIKVLGWVEDGQLLDLVGKCRAAIYIPIDEDAGMTHLEANSAGKPVLTVNEGGLVETTIHNQTGIIIKSDPTETDIINGINQMTAEWCLSKKEICIKHAQKYSLEKFNEKINRIILENNPNRPIIGLDASRWEDPRHPGKQIKTGVEVYSTNLINHLIPLIKQHGDRVRVYTPRTITELPLSIQKVIPGQKRWTQKYLNNELKHSPVNYFFTPSYYIPKHAPQNSFVTIHDVQFKQTKNKYSFLDKLKQDFITRLNISRAKKIFTVSAFSRHEIIKYYKSAQKKVFVVPIGYDRKENLNLNLARENKIVFIGRIEKKKSPELLIEAFAGFLSNHADWQLVLAGKPGFGFIEIQQLIAKLDLTDNVVLPGYISEEEKFKLLLTSKIFTHPGSAEGSSIPLFEAWDAGVPALISGTEVFREIGGNGALYFETDNKADLELKLTELASNENLQESLVQTGLNNLKNMAWSITANQIFSKIIE